MIRLYDTNFKALDPAFYTYRDMLRKSSETAAGLQSTTNVYCSVSHCAAGYSRAFIKSNIFAIDLDHIEGEHLFTRQQEYLGIVAKHLQANPADLSMVLSGHGLHVMLHLDEKSTWENRDYYAKHRMQYNELCKRIDADICAAGLSGYADTSIFDPTRVLRMPATINKKDALPPADCVLLQLSEIDLPFDFDSVCAPGPVTPKLAAKKFVSDGPGANLPVPANQITPDSLLYFKPDIEGIEEGCEFLKWAKHNQAELSEQQWYAVLGIVAFLDDDNELAHQYSSDYPTYSVHETDKKANQARNHAAPRTCADIDTRWDGCRSCPHWGMVNCAVSIHSEDFIRTEQTGFWYPVQQANGKTKLLPALDDIAKKFKQTFRHKFIGESQSWWIWVEGVWVTVHEDLLLSKIHNFFKPEPTQSMHAKEALTLIKRQEVTPMSFFFDTIENKINLKSQILDLNTMTIMPHNPLYGFTSKLDFDYAPGEDCPEFKAWLLETLSGDQSLVDTVLDFMAYALAGNSFVNDKILYLTGGGANGKSTLIKLFKMILSDSFCTLDENDLGKPFRMMKAVGKKVMYFDEFSPKPNSTNWNILKSLSSGGDFGASEKFKPEFEAKNNAKIIISANNLPNTYDASNGFFRRFLIIPFERTIEEADQKNNKENDFKDELPGILNLLLERMVTLKARDWKIYTPKASKDAVEEFKLDKDPVTGFYKDMFDHDALIFTHCDKYKWATNTKAFGSPKSAILQPLVYKVFGRYCEENGIRGTLTNREFIKRFKTTAKIQTHTVKFRTSTCDAYIGIVPNAEFCKLADTLGHF